MDKQPTPDDLDTPPPPFWDFDLLAHLGVILVAGVGLAWPYFDDAPRQLLLHLPTSPALMITIAGGLAALFLHQAPERP